MAKQVKMAKGREFTFKAATGGAVASKFPWDTWLNGDLLLLERDILEPTGENDEDGNPKFRTKTKRDYDGKTDDMAGKIKAAARRKYKIVQISKLDADGNKLVDSLIIRARPMTADETVAEDIKRAEEKEAFKASEAKRKAKAAAEAASANGTPAAAPTTAPATA